MFFSKTIKEYEKIPGGYGLSYYPIGSNIFVAHPIPINLFAGLFHNLKFWMRKFLKHGFGPSKAEKIYRQGYEAGLKKEPKKAVK